MADRGARRKTTPRVDPDKPYQMSLPNLGHAVIINNVVDEMPGSVEDVEALKTTYEKVGFKVQVHTDCSVQEMRKLKRWIIDNRNHEKSNTFLLTIICHGNKHGHLLDRNKSKAWDTEEFVGDLCEVEALIGKPKILTIQCCRGSQYSTGKPLPRGALAEEDLEPPHIVADKADLFLAYATVPGYIAFGGDEHGSTYLQAFATYLREEYLQRPLDRIYLMVKQHMARSQQGSDGFKQCSEERNSLTRVLHFGQFHGVNTFDTQKTYEEEIERLRKEKKEMEEKMEREIGDMRKKMEGMKTEADKAAKALKQQGEISVEVISTSELDLEQYHGFTALTKTGEVVTCGSVSHCGPFFLYFLTLQNGKIEENKMNLPCRDYKVSLLSIFVNKVEYLAVACDMCHDIKLLDLETKKVVSKAFIYMNKIQKICHGQPGRLFIFCGRDIFELDCSGQRFKQIQEIPAGINVCGNLCYVPSPHNLIIASDENCREITAISVHSKQTIWTVDEIDGEGVNTGAFLYLPVNKMILIGGTDRILVLNPADGTHLHTIQLPVIGWVQRLCFHDNQLFAIQCKDYTEKRLSSFSVKL